MKIKNFSVIITSISQPNEVLKQISCRCLSQNIKLYVIGDTKSPKSFHIDGCNFYSVNDQKKLGFNIIKECPEQHYSRKNIGYLLAMNNGCEVIVETDDDNFPMEKFWNSRKLKQKSLLIENKGWVNIYSYFSKKHLWARGFPLEFINNNKTDFNNYVKETIDSPIQQGLANTNPDVDAIFRMTKDLPVNFDRKNPIALGVNTWHPFNSQNTTWFKEAFPLLYLPSFCSFRMTDIWRSFIAQRIAWACNWKILYHSPTVFQERNEHNLLKDFKDEVPGYLNNVEICKTLQNLKLKSGKNYLYDNLKICYNELVKRNWIDNEKELFLLDLWIKDLKTINKEI